MIRVVVSREFEVESGTDVGKTFATFVERGWKVSADVSQSPSPSPQIASVAPLIEEIMGKHNLSRRGVGSLIGVSHQSIRGWMRGTSVPCSESISRIERLARRSRRTPATQSQRLRDEARGASRVRQLSRVRPRKLNDDQKIAIAERRAGGERVCVLAGEFGVTPQTIRNVYRQVAG